MKSFLGSLLGLLTVLLVSSHCSSVPKSNGDRGVANVEQEEFEDSFLNLFEQALTNNPDDKILEPFAQTNLQIIKRAYYYLDLFDQELDRIATECEEKRQNEGTDATCEDPLNLTSYRKLLASRIIIERQKDRLAYYYKRLLDLGNSQDDSLEIVYEATENQLASASSDEQRDEWAQAARAIKNKWDVELRDLINVNTDTEGVISYEVAIELFKLREAAALEWSELAGKDFSPSDILRGKTDDLTIYYEDKMDQLKREAQASTAIPDHPDLDSLMSLIPKRTPQSAWKNHTGNSFERGQWALTYDDGPKASTTNQILDILAQKKWHATFFWLAQNAKASSNRAVVNKAKSLGMGLANHSYSHANLGKAGANLQREIVQSKSDLEAVYGVRLNFFRLPYGSGTNSGRVQQTIAGLGMEHFFWNVDSLDWKDPSPESIYNRIRKQMATRSGGIILLHDIHSKTVATTKLLAQRLSGVKIISLEQGRGVGKRANTGGGGSNPQPIPAPPQSSFEPHTRVIIVDSLNVRLNAGETNVPPCGNYSSGTRVRVIGQDPRTGWYVVDTAADRPNRSADSPYYCPDRQRKAWISGGAAYSQRLQ